MNEEKSVEVIQVTEEMQRAWVSYDPPQRYGDAVVASADALIAGAVRAAFYAGWQASRSTPPAEDAVKAARCQHEPYQGRCVHCDIPFRFGRPSYGDYPASGIERLVEALEAADGALRNYACQGPGAPCLRTPAQCADNCGLGAAQALEAVESALSSLKESGR
jgi:hypothetical protein